MDTGDLYLDPSLASSASANAHERMVCADNNDFVCVISL